MENDLTILTQLQPGLLSLKKKYSSFKHLIFFQILLYKHRHYNICLTGLKIQNC